MRPKRSSPEPPMMTVGCPVLGVPFHYQYLNLHNDWRQQRRRQRFPGGWRRGERESGVGRIRSDHFGSLIFVVVVHGRDREFSPEAHASASTSRQVQVDGETPAGPDQEVLRPPTTAVRSSRIGVPAVDGCTGQGRKNVPWTRGRSAAEFAAHGLMRASFLELNAGFGIGVEKYNRVTSGEVRSEGTAYHGRGLVP